MGHAHSHVPQALAVARWNTARILDDLELAFPAGEAFGETSFHVLGLAQSLVDVTVTTSEDSVDDKALLLKLGVEKGGRRVLDTYDERTSVMDTIEEEGCAFEVTPGGSLANTLVAISRLSMAHVGRSRLRVALGASTGTDAVGQFYSSHMASAGVSVVPAHEDGVAASAGATGTVFVLASPDAQRSFLSHFNKDELTLSTGLRSAIASSRLVIVEGYLWELPNAAAVISEVVAIAKAAGAQVALTAGDPGVAARHREQMLHVLEAGGQSVLMFANRDEAAALLGDRTADARACAASLGSLCSLVVVTDGAAGSHVCCMGELHAIPPPRGVSPVDTCGAGDNFAAGFCYALLMGHACDDAGAFGASVAGRVIGRHGAQLLEEEAAKLVALLPPVCAFART